MGTTAEKLTYLSTTKNYIKESINLTNINITNEPFRYYAYAIKKGIINVLNNPKEIWNNFEKVTGEGTSIELTSTENAPIEINLKGNLSQSGEPTPTDPVEINVVSGDNTITIVNSDNTETQTQLISLGDIELCEIGNYQDYIYKTDKWYLHKEIGKYTLNGSESWSKYGSSGTINQLKHDVSNLPLYYGNQLANGNSLKCSHFISVGYSNYWNKNNSILFALVASLFVQVEMSVSDFKTWLQSNNVNVYYILKTPTNTEITDSTLIYQLEKTLYSYSGLTNISQTNNDLPFILDVKALKLIE